MIDATEFAVAQAYCDSHSFSSDRCIGYPQGRGSPTVFQVCQELGLRPLDWSVDPRDWSRPGADHIVDTVLGHTHTGSIILEHDGGGDRSQTVAALGRFLPKLLEQGYRFVQP